MNFQTMSKQRKFILIAAAVGVISMFLPWVSISMGPFGGVSTNGFHGAGIFVFLCFAACGVLAFLGDQTKNLDKTFWMICLIAGGLAALIMIINFLQALDSLSYLSFGFYLAVLASIAVVAATYVFRNPGDSIKGGFDSLKHDVEEKTKSDNTSNPS
jgi:peptidoglycan/LPS O-acetylase OafA/YrhL